MEQSDKREFFRISDRLFIEFRQISYEDFLRLRRLVEHNSTQIVDKISEVYFLEERERKDENDRIFAYMQVINKKLDTVIEFLSKSLCAEDYQAMETLVNISGAGVQFECETGLKQGDYAEFKVNIPVFPYPKITALCEVLRREELGDEEKTGTRIAMKFLVIHEKDRDILINYIFLKERERLRKKNGPAG